LQLRKRKEKTRYYEYREKKLLHKLAYELFMKHK